MHPTEPVSTLVLLPPMVSLLAKLLVADFLRYFIVAAVFFLVFWKALGKRLAPRLVFGQWAKPSQLWRELGFSMVTVVIFALNGLGLVTGVKRGVFHIYADVQQHGVPYLVLSVAAIILAHDAYFYWTHRAMHHPSLYRLFHKVHHLSVHTSPWTAYAFHPLEAAVEAVFLPLYLLLVPTHQLVALVFVTHMILRNVWGHLGMELLPPWLNEAPFVRWLNSTTHHAMHHRYAGTNFSLYFRFWDRLMKTEHLEYEAVYKTVAERRVGGLEASELASRPSL